jgi:hypothetical protein
MGEDVPVQVVVELERTGSTISGHVAVAGAPPTEFFGWLELIDRLERAAPPGAHEQQTDDRPDLGCDQLEGNGQ